MTTQDTLAELKKKLSAERCCLKNPYSTRSDMYPKLWSEGHEAATDRLMPLLEKAVEMANFYAPSDSYDYDKTQGVNYIWNDQGKKAREFLASLEDGVGKP